MSLEIGQLIEGKYRIARLIGEGGMGAVYEGENVRINRRVAIKVLHAAFTGNSEVMNRFEREAQAAGRIGNDHILEVLDLGSFPDGDHYIVMEYLDGDSLSARIKERGRITPQELTSLIRQVLVGLSAAHQAGIVHRDLKPDNIFILKEKAGTRNFVKIIDFGISKFQPLAGDGMKMTRTGAVMGTPYYMSPEQASGSHEADQRSDIYSVGVIMFEAITGRVPFDAATFNQLMFKIVLAEVPTVESVVPDADTAYSSLIAKAMARDAAHRFQSCQDFIRALDDWSQRGTAVSVPPQTDGAAAGLVPAQRPPAASGAGARTAGTWATSQPDAAAILPKKGLGPVALFAGVGVLVLAGGAFAAFRGLSGDEPSLSPPPPQLAASAPAVAHPAPTSVKEPQIKPLEAAPPAPTSSSKAESAAIPSSVNPQAARPPSLAPRVPATKKPSASGKVEKPATKPVAKSTAAPDFGY